MIEKLASQKNFNTNQYNFLLKEDFKNINQNIIFIYPKDTEKLYREAIIAHEALLKHLVKKLKNYLGLEEFFWKLQLKFVLFDLVLSTHIKYSQLKHLKDNAKVSSLILSKYEISDLIIKNQNDLNLKIQESDYFNSYIYEKIARSLKFKILFNNNKNKIIKKLNKKLLNKFLYLIKHINNYFSLKFLENNSIIITGIKLTISEYIKLIFKKRTIFLFPNVNKFPIANNKLDLDLRKKIFDTKNEDNHILKIIYEILETSFPIQFIENIELIKKEFKNIKKNPKIIFSPNSWFYDDYFISMAYFLSNKNTIKIAAQHGGPSIFERYKSYENLELTEIDHYLKWGNYIPHKKMISISSLKNKIRNNLSINYQQKKLTIISTCFPSYRITPECPITNFLKTKEIIKSCSKITKTITYRPHFQSKFINLIKNEFPEIEVNLNDNFRKIILDSNFMIFTYFGTSTAEALYNKVPCYIFIDKYHKICSQYSFIFEKLIDSKIVFFETKDLANQLKIDFDSNLNWLDNFDRKKSIDFFNRNLMESNFNYNSALFNLSK